MLVGLTITPVTLGANYSVALDDGVTYNLVFDKNRIGNYYVVTISIAGEAILRRKVVSRVDIFAGKAINKIYAQDASLIETEKTRFVIE